MPAGACSEEQTEECSRLEESVAERYKDRKSDDNKRMRGELQKVSSRTETSMLSKKYTASMIYDISPGEAIVIVSISVCCEE